MTDENDDMIEVVANAMKGCEKFDWKEIAKIAIKTTLAIQNNAKIEG